MNTDKKETNGYFLINGLLKSYLWTALLISFNFLKILSTLFPLYLFTLFIHFISNCYQFFSPLWINKLGSALWIY